MVSRILSSGESSRLYRALVDEQQKALFVGNFPLALEDPGVSLSFGITNMGVDVYELEKAIDAEVTKVQNELITEKEFEKLRNQIESEFVTSNSRVAGIAESLATYHMFFGDANLINNEIDRYLAVTREDIQAAAKKYLVKNNRVTLHYLPKAQESKS
jgi:zinc protease